MTLTSDNNLLSVRGLATYFQTHGGTVRAVQNVSFDVRRGSTFAIVGESGCGKSVTALSIMRLIPTPPGRVAAGNITLRGRDLLSLPEREMRGIRGNEIAMIFQEPMTSLNPVFTVGDQIIEAIMLHQKKGRGEARKEAVRLLARVGIPDPEERFAEYPHQMSGGMRQRAMIAMAISCKPALLIADEPTTALDVTIQAQILDLLDELQQQDGMSILLITHDLGVVAERADDTAVMYASRIVETGATEAVLAEPLHPYTQGLLQSRPQLGSAAKRLAVIPGSVPDPRDFPSGCKFHPRCPIGSDDPRCASLEPELRQVSEGRCVSCWHAKGYETPAESQDFDNIYGREKRKQSPA
ncbi:MAG TPA: ABC transporter ATP-binding protein [Sedimentisphaerales bacterium]|nr:ABC transporter ATP-binding protein [Sedimentisphaerales bacterium]